jgi:hypothetical protein
VHAHNKPRTWPETPHLAGNPNQLNLSDVEIYQRSIGLLTSPRWFRCQVFF